MRPSKLLYEKGKTILHLVSSYHVRELRIFGSTARGTDNDHSDLDLFVIYESRTSIFTHAALSNAIEHTLGIKCDVLCDELLELDNFKGMMEISVPLLDWLNGRRLPGEQISQEERQVSSKDNFEWIISRIIGTVKDISYQEFAELPYLYDALAYQLILLSSITKNARQDEIEEIQQKYNVNLSGSSKLYNLLTTSLYPKMVYHAACEFIKTL